MEKALFKNDDFEITPQTTKDDLYKFQLNLKGKKVAKGSDLTDMWEFTSDGVRAATVLNFEVQNLPQAIHHYISFSGKTCMGMHYVVGIFKDNETQDFDFCFRARDHHFLTMLINPTQIILAFSKLAKAKGYKVKCDLDDPDFGPYVDVIIKLPTKGNMYQHYKKHLEVFEALFAKAQEQVKKRINKK